jgi:RNA polymerase sigma-70 factor (ECF subfamily)
VSRYKFAALRVALLLVQDRALAEDSVQDSFLLAYRRADQVRAGAPFAPWFQRIVLSTARFSQRSATRRRERSLENLANRDAQPDAELLALHVPQALGAEQSAERGEVRATVVEAPRALALKQRVVLIARYFCGYQVDEVVHLLGCPAGTVRWRLRAAPPAHARRWQARRWQARRRAEGLLRLRPSPAAGAVVVRRQQSHGFALQDGTPFNRAVTAQGVTLRLEEGCADAARTTSSMRISGPDARHPAASNVHDARLVDANGQCFAPFTSMQLNDVGLVEFRPLSLAELSGTLPLTLTAPTLHVGDGLSSSIGGPWSIVFQVQLQLGRSVSFAVSPQTRGGITMPPERLDLAPAGARRLLRVSGLPLDSARFSLAHFSHRGDDIVACPPGGRVCASIGRISDGMLLQRIAPDGQALTPGSVGAASDTAVSIARPATVVGPSGSAELAFLFFAPLRTATGTGGVTIDQIRLSSIHAGADAPEQVIPGPWMFELPLD